jgi:hypothetical protein
LEQRAREVLLGLLAAKDPLDRQECRETLDQVDLQVKLVHPVCKVSAVQLDQQDHLVQSVSQVQLVPVVILGSPDILGQREQPEGRECQDLVARMGHLDFRDLSEQLGQPEARERLDLRVQLALRDLRDCRDHRVPLDRRV